MKTFPDQETGKSREETVPVGTVASILPTILESGQIRCDVNCTISDIIGRANVGGTEYPVVSSQIFSAPLTIASGQTICIEGLNEAVVDPKSKKPTTSHAVLVKATAVPASE